MLKILEHGQVSEAEAEAALLRLDGTPATDLLIIARYLAQQITALDARVDALEIP